MAGVIRVALLDPDDASREKLKGQLLSMDLVWLEAECSRLEFFLEMVTQSRPDLAVIALEPDPGRAIGLVQQVTSRCPSGTVLVVSDSDDGQQILSAIRAGAKEYLKRPIDLPDLVQAIQRLCAPALGAGGDRGGGARIVTVIGATGGVGATTIAVNLGCAQAQANGQSAVLVDLDLAVGDADICLDLLPDYTLADVAANISRLDLTLLKRSLAKHASGLFLLSRPNRLEEAGAISADQVRRVLGLLKATFSHVVVDTSKSFLPTDQVALEMADDILLVTQLDLPCLRNVVRLLMAMGEAGSGLADKVKVVLNRLGLEDGEISIKKAEETIGREIFWQIPNDWKTVITARNSGVPLVSHSPRSKVTQAIQGLRARLNGQGAEAPAKRRGLFSFLG